MKTVSFPLRESKSFLVKFSVGNDRFGMYVRAVDTTSAIWKVQQLVDKCQNMTAEEGSP